MCVLSPVHTVHTFRPPQNVFDICRYLLFGKKIGRSLCIGFKSHDIEKKKKKEKNQVIYRVCCNVHCKVHWIAYEQSYKTSNLTALTYVTVRSDITLQYTMQHVLNFFRLHVFLLFFFWKQVFTCVLCACKFISKIYFPFYLTQD